MTAHVISHRKARRKRATAWSWTARRFGALAVTLAALATATWLAPRYRQTSVPTLAAPSPAIETAPATLGRKPIGGALTMAIKLPPRARTTRIVEQAPPPVPLNAMAGERMDGFEVLSAAELAAISQARN